MGDRSTPALKSCPQATLSQIEARFAPCVCPTLLEQNAKKEFSRKRIYSRARTFWCWIWQILQGNTSCREVVRQVQLSLRWRVQDPSMKIPPATV